MKRILLVLVCLMLTVGLTLMPGCKPSVENSSENSSVISDENSDTQSSSDESVGSTDGSQVEESAVSAGGSSVAVSKSDELDGNFYTNPANPKIVKNKITIKMFVPKSPIQPDWEKMVLFQEMERRTNIHVEFEEVLLSSYQERRSLKWEDRKNPTDAFFLANNMDEIVLYASRGALTPLNDLIDKYAPNYKKWLTKYPEMKRAATLSDGKMYSFSSVDTISGQAAKQYINKQWLDDLSLPVPKTIDEFYNVLKAFKENDPNGKNGADEIPMSYINSDQTRNFIMSAFGYVGTGMELDRKANKMVWVPSTNNYREYLKFMNKIYKEGLLDPYIFSNQSSDLVVKGRSMQLGCFSTAGAFLVVGMENDSDYTSFGPLTSSVNSQKMWYQFGRQFDPSIIIIPSSTKYSREIVRWMDAFYDETTVPLQSNGIENIDWKWNDSAKTKWTFMVPNGMEREQYRATLTYQAGLGGAILSNGFNLKDSSPETVKINKEAEIYRPYLREVFPILKYTSSEMRTIRDIEAQVNNYLLTAEANFIKNIKDPNNDNHWNEHVSNLNKIGITRLVEAYQAAYSRYK